MRKISCTLHWQLPPALQWIILGLLLVLPVAFIATQYQAKQGFSALIFFGADFQPQASTRLAGIQRVVIPGPGYDGQFYAQLALDPLLLDPSTAAALDGPAYRARRILVPLLAFVAGLGQPTAVITVYALINLLFFTALLLVLNFYLRPHTVQDFLIVSAIAWTGGVLASVSRALVDLPASVLLLYACFLPPSRGALALAAAVLARETSLLSLLSVVWPGAELRDWRRNGRLLLPAILRTALLSALIVLPLATWLLYLDFILQPGAQSSSLAGSGNFSLPFVGWGQHILANLETLLQAQRPSALGELAANLAFSVQAAYLIAFPRPGSPFWRMGIGFALLYFCLGSLVFANQLAYGRVMLPLTFAFNLLLWQKEPRHFLTWFLVGNAGLALGFLTSFMF